MYKYNIAIGYKQIDGPFGGGMRFADSLKSFLEQNDFAVFHDLKQPDLDLILMTEPRSYLQSSAFNDKDIFHYLKKVNPQALVVHRINECDERKGTDYVNNRLIVANLCADYTVFVGSWLEKHFINLGLPCRSTGVILNGSDTQIFNPDGYQPWQKGEKFKVVTHHWGGSWLKGFDIYQKLDRMLDDKKYHDQFEFSYIGKIPADFAFKNVTHIQPLNGLELAGEIKKHHVYLTASQFEPGGNHQNEGANCGLPLLYRNSGCMPEYCSGYGVMFDAGNFEEKLMEIKNSYFTWVEKMPHFPLNSTDTSKQYVQLFRKLLENKRLHIEQRKNQFSKWFFKTLISRLRISRRW